MKQLIKLIKNSKRVAIIAHASPDPDCMSSLTALSLALKKLGKTVDGFIDTSKSADHYSFYSFDTNFNTDIKPENYDTIISVDVATPRLMGKYYPAFNIHNNSIAIDHHQSRDLTASYVYVDAKKSSCCEIIYELILALKVKITPQMATYLFAGIIGDTNCFENDNTTENSHIVAAKLYALGADTKEVIFKFKKHQKMPDLKIRELGYKNMVIKNQVAYMIFTNKMYDEAGTDSTADFVNELLNLEDTLFAFVIKQKEKNTYTVSLRCKSGYNVASVASKFGGGGHEQASGLSFVGAPVRHAKLIYDECKKQIKEVKNV